MWVLPVVLVHIRGRVPMEAMLGIAFVIHAFPVAASATPPTIWEMVVAVREPTPVELQGKEGALEYWGEAWAHLGSQLFQRLQARPIPQVEIDEFVGGFGTKGARVDMLWLGLDEYALIPQNPPIFVTELGDSEFKRNYNLWHDGVALSIARRAAQDEAFLQRYYRMVLWTGCFIREGPENARGPMRRVTFMGLPRQGWHPFFQINEAIMNLRFCVPDNRSGDYYGEEARRLVLLQYAFGRNQEVVLEGAEVVRAACEHLCDWVTARNVTRYDVDGSGLRWIVRHRHDGGAVLQDDIVATGLMRLTSPFELQPGERLPWVAPGLLSSRFDPIVPLAR